MLCLRYAGVQWLHTIRKLSHSASGIPVYEALLVRAHHQAIKRNVTTISFRILNNFSVNRMFSETSVKLKKAKVSITYIKANGDRTTAEGKEGDNLLDIAINNNVDLEGFGACEGTLSCSTCHLIFKKNDYDMLEEEPTDEELDMLDLAFDRKPTSRLGCQVCVTKELDGLEVSVPAGVLDARDTS